MAETASSLDRLDLFATPLGAVLVPNAAQLNQDLAPRVLQLRGAETEDEGPLPWQSPPRPLQQNDGGVNQLAWMTHCLAESIAPPLPWTGPGQPQWEALWFAEILKPGQGLPIHDFPRAEWCGCYLVDDGGAAPDAAVVELLDPRGPASVTYAPDLTYQGPGSEVLGISQTVSLPSGGLLVFPAWMRQGAELHRGERQRLSIKLLLSRRGRL